MARSPASEPAGPRLWPLWLAWTVFVVYGSLVPLDFRPLPWSDAWQRLLQAPMLRLGIESRADWVANGVLYLPVGFLSTAVLMGRRAGFAQKSLAAVLGVAFGWALALGVEFAQTAFPPRSVSRNDLLAEAIGTTLGMLVAWGGAGRLRVLLLGFAASGAALRPLLAPFYLLAFAAWALFPFDLLLDAGEWAHKLHSGHVAWWLADTRQAQPVWQVLGKSMVEVLAVVPLGTWWASRQAAAVPPGRARLGQALLLGALLGLSTELAQLLIASGISQGASVATRALGFAVGAWALRPSTAEPIEAVRAHLRRSTRFVLPVYLLLLTLHFGWWAGPWLEVDQVWQRLAHEVRFVPFYYHYFTTEMRALVSLVATIACYAPIGLLGWGWHLRAGTSAWVAGFTALVIEAGRLLAAGAKPDPTNVLIAAAAGWLVCRLVSALTRKPAQLRPSHA